MDFGVSNILLEESKSKNKTALNGIVRAKASLIRMKISGILNSNVRSQYDVIDNVLDEANKGISSLKKDDQSYTNSFIDDSICLYVKTTEQ